MILLSIAANQWMRQNNWNNIVWLRTYTSWSTRLLRLMVQNMKSLFVSEHIQIVVCVTLHNTSYYWELCQARRCWRQERDPAIAPHWSKGQCQSWDPWKDPCVWPDKAQHWVNQRRVEEPGSSAHNRAEWWWDREVTRSWFLVWILHELAQHLKNKKIWINLKGRNDMNLSHTIDISTIASTVE